MDFTNTVIITSLVLLVIILVFIAISMSSAKKSMDWPPIIPDCPDYWVDLSGNGKQCINKLNLGTCNNPSSTGEYPPMDFTVAPYVGSKSKCAKFTWANACGVTWDGITTGGGSPCATNILS